MEKASPGDSFPEMISPRGLAGLAGYQLLFGCALMAGAGLVPWLSSASRRVREGFHHYLGRLPMPPSGPLAWVHGVSMGETLVACGLIEALRARFPGLVIGTTTTHPDVMKVLSRRVVGDSRAFFPLDFLPCLETAFNRWNPRIILLTETDFWPAFSFLCRQREIPLVLVNGRISDKILDFYSCFRAMAECVFGGFSAMCVQTEYDARKLRELGVAHHRIHVTGNLKVDLAMGEGKPPPREIVVWKGDSPLVAFGSIHPSEFEMLLPVFRTLAREGGVKVILAPRNVALARSWKAALEKTGIGAALRSGLPTGGLGSNLLLLDSFGELASVYGLAGVGFVGGTLDPAVGGHNPIEVLARKVPLLIGPHSRNFQDLVDQLRTKGGVLVESHSAGIEAAIRRLLEDRDFSRNQIYSADGILEANSGAIGRTLDLIAPFVPITT